MPTVFFTLRNTAIKDAEEHWRITSLLWQPAIPFDPKHNKKSTDKHSSKDADSSDDEETGKVTLYTKIDPNGDLEDGNKISHKVPRYKTGTPEEFCAWRTAVQEFFKTNGTPNDAGYQLSIYRSLFSGAALETFQKAFNRESKANDDKPINKRKDLMVLLDRAINEVALRVFKQGKEAYKIQRRYLRMRIPIGAMDVREYTDRLDDINGWLQYFPVDTNKIVGRNGNGDFHRPLDDDELMDLLHFAQPVEWNIRNLQQGNNGFFSSLDAMKEAYAMYQDADKLVATMDKLKLNNNNKGNGDNKHRQGGNPKKRRRGRRRSRGRDDDSNDSSKGQAKKKKTNNQNKGAGKAKGDKCPHCGRHHAKPFSECWTLPANKDKRPEWFTIPGKSQKQNSNTIQESPVLIQPSMLKKLVQKAAAQPRKRTVIEDSDGEDDSFAAFVARETGIGEYMEELRNNSSNNESKEESSGYSLFPFHTPEPEPKHSKSAHYTAEIIVQLVDGEGQLVPIRALLDTGTSATIILQRYVKKGTPKGNPHKLQEWNTLGGKFYTKKQADHCIQVPRTRHNKNSQLGMPCG